MAANPKPRLCVNNASPRERKAVIVNSRSLGFENDTGKAICVIHRDGTVDVIAASRGINRKGTFKFHMEVVSGTEGEYYISDDRLIDAQEVELVDGLLQRERCRYVTCLQISSEDIDEPGGVYVPRYDVVLSSNPVTDLPKHPALLVSAKAPPTTLSQEMYYVSHGGDRQIYTVVAGNVARLTRQKGITEGIYIVTHDVVNESSNSEIVPFERMAEGYVEFFPSRMDAVRYLNTESTVSAAALAALRKLNSENAELKRKLLDGGSYIEFEDCVITEQESSFSHMRQAYKDDQKHKHDVRIKEIDLLSSALTRSTTLSSNNLKHSQDKHKAITGVISDVSKIKI